MSENGDRPDDDLHDEQLSQLYRRLPGGEPRAETDAAIRRAAHEAVTPRNNANTNWQRLLPLAAGVVLAAGLLTFWHGTPPMPGAAKPLASAPAESAAPQTAPALAAPPAAAPEADRLAQAPESKRRYTATAPAAAAPQPSERKAEDKNAEVDALMAPDDRQVEAAGAAKAAPKPALPAAPAPQEQIAGAPSPAAPATANAAAPTAKMQAAQSDAAPAHRSLRQSEPPWRRYMQQGDFDHARQLINHDIAMNGDAWARLDYDLLGLLTSTSENTLLCAQDHGTQDQSSTPAQQACALLTDYQLGKASAAELDAVAAVLPEEKAYWLAAARKLLKSQAH